ncbi:hypothetical protein EVAR_1037_1 [Eumeta japonica]|uniref:Uncharacterized protein n=1 Tax=Eumeta variegata TaxID=151549 RepID=A0A4C1S8K6_EUMVA|nr:hypothetical protein EVAR_1037_1 [Eumeta japonica]
MASSSERAAYAPRRAACGELVGTRLCVDAVNALEKPFVVIWESHHSCTFCSGDSISVISSRVCRLRHWGGSGWLQFGHISRLDAVDCDCYGFVLDLVKNCQDRRSGSPYTSSAVDACKSSLKHRIPSTSGKVSTH